MPSHAATWRHAKHQRTCLCFKSVFNINWISRRDVNEGAGLLAKFCLLILVIGLPLMALIAIATFLDPLGLLPPMDDVFNGRKKDPPGLIWRVPLSLLAITAIAFVILRPLLRPLRAKLQAAAEEKARQDEEAVRQWLLNPPPALEVPTRFSEQWFAATIPSMHPGQWPSLNSELRARGWTPEKIETRLSRYVAANPYVDLHHELTAHE